METVSNVACYVVMAFKGVIASSKIETREEDVNNSLACIAICNGIHGMFVASTEISKSDKFYT